MENTKTVKPRNKYDRRDGRAIKGGERMRNIVCNGKVQGCIYYQLYILN